MSNETTETRLTSEEIVTGLEALRGQVESGHNVNAEELGELVRLTHELALLGAHKAKPATTEPDKEPEGPKAPAKSGKE